MGSPVAEHRHDWTLQSYIEALAAENFLPAGVVANNGDLYAKTEFSRAVGHFLRSRE